MGPILSFKLSAALLTLPAGQQHIFDCLAASVWVETGALTFNEASADTEHAAHAFGPVHTENAGSAGARALVYAIHAGDAATHDTFANEHMTRLREEHVRFEPKETVFRLDRVTFPPGAVAYRHIHPGPGIRYLTRGKLEISSDHDTLIMQAGDTWFEGANAPVKATADPHATSEFVRVLLLPAEYQGRPTLKRLKPEDLEKPTLQTNHRYFDHLLDRLTS